MVDVVDGTARLPLEIFQRFFDGWTFLESQALLRVCRRWRLSIMDHPSYWRDVALKATTAGAVQLFLLRLSRATTRPFSVDIDAPRSWDALLTTICPAILSCMNYIEQLAFHIHAAQAQACLDSLSLQAPLLWYLYFHVELDEYSRPALPVDIFDHHAPHLRSISLRNVDFPPCAIPVLFTVRSLTLATGTYDLPCASRPIPNLFHYFPRARVVRITGNTLLLDSAYRDGTLWQGVVEFVSNGPLECLEHIVQELPISCIPRIHVGNFDELQSDVLVGHLRGPLHVILHTHVSLAPGKFELCMSAGRLTRSFTEGVESWESPDVIPHNWLWDVDILARIVDLTISDTLWQPVAAAFVLPLPNLAHLRLVLHASDVQAARTGTALRCPKLQRLSLRCEVAVVAVSAADVERVVQVNLRDAALPLELALEHVLYESSVGCDPAVFSPVSTRALSEWRHPYDNDVPS